MHNNNRNKNTSGLEVRNYICTDIGDQYKYNYQGHLE